MKIFHSKMLVENALAFLPSSCNPKNQELQPRNAQFLSKSNLYLFFQLKLNLPLFKFNQKPQLKK